MRFKIISCSVLSDYMQDDQCLLIDLRDFSEYCLGHIPGAHWVDWQNVEAHVQELTRSYQKKYHSCPCWLILYCEHGNISLVTARDLARRGYPVISLNGGWQRWQGAVETGYPPDTMYRHPST